MSVFNLYYNGVLERVAALAIVNTVIISAAILIAQRLAAPRAATRDERQAVKTAADSTALIAQRSPLGGG